MFYVPRMMTHRSTINQFRGIKVREIKEIIPFTHCEFLVTLMGMPSNIFVSIQADLDANLNSRIAVLGTGSGPVNFGGSESRWLEKV